MNLIYSLNTNLLKYDYDKSNLDKLIKNYELSIKLAKQYHNIILYTDEYGASKLGGIVDDIQFLKKDKNYLWSEAKFEALSKIGKDSFELAEQYFSGTLSVNDEELNDNTIVYPIPVDNLFATPIFARHAKKKIKNTH